MDERRIVYYSIVEKSDIKADNVIVKLETNQAITLLKKQLNYLDLKLPEIYISANGKSYFKNSNLFFNYSHSKSYIACTVSFYEVGIDIEETTRNIIFMTYLCLTNFIIFFYYFFFLFRCSHFIISLTKF